MLTPKQKEVYQYIHDYFEVNGHAPTQREIKDHFGLKSFGSVQRYIKYLVDAGHLESDWNARRGLRPLAHDDEFEKESDSISIPLLGRVAAGGPIPAIEYLHEQLTIPKQMVKNGENYFALKVVGDSMIEDAILDGDFVICQKRDYASNGQIVVALLEDSATVKRFYKHSKEIELRPSNSALTSIIVRDRPLLILGIVVGLIRSFA